MNNPLITKLSRGNHLTSADEETIARLTSERIRIPADQDIVSQGDRPDAINLVVTGLACRYKTLRNDDRSIMAFLIPGDLCDLHVAIIGSMDHSIKTLTECEIVKIPSRAIDRLSTTHPNVARALWWSLLRDEAILREWLVCVGRRPAMKRVAHLLCELWHRYTAAGLISGGRLPFPVTQEELADTVGLSTIHVNRTLKSLKHQNLAWVSGKTVIIPDLSRLELFVGFDQSYLHQIGNGGKREVEGRSHPRQSFERGES